MTERAEAERKALDAAPYGVIKLDAENRVLYANPKALELFELPLDQLAGQDVRQFVKDKRSHKEVMRQSHERRRGRGSQYNLLFTTPRTNRLVNLRVTSVPQFDAQGRFRGALAGLQPIDHEIAREDIARLIATENDYQALFDGLLKILERFSFDWADFSLYTKDRAYARPICRRAKDRPRYNNRWFEIRSRFANSSSSRSAGSTTCRDTSKRRQTVRSFWKTPTCGKPSNMA